MKTYRIPILTWTNSSGLFTGIPAESNLVGDALSAVADTRKDVLEQLKSAMDWAFRRAHYDLDPDLHDAVLSSIQVAVRPRYATCTRDYPCGEVLDLSVPCVNGVRENGMFVCSVPTLGLIFQQLKLVTLRQTAMEGVQRQLSSCDPRALAPLLTVESPELSDINLRQRSGGKGAGVFEPALPALNAVARPMGRTDFRKRFLPAWKREAEVQTLGEQLTKSSSVLLVGERKVGKSTLLIAAIRNAERRYAQAADDDQASGEFEQPYRHRFWHSSAARLIAGMQYLGEWQQRCEEVIADLSEIHGMLYIESLTDLLMRGGSAPEDSVAAYMMSFVRSGELRLVSEVTPEELETSRRLLPGFVDLFEQRRVEPLDDQAARAALAELGDQKKRDTKVTLEGRTIDHTARLFRRFYPYEPLPGRAAEFLVQTFADATQNHDSSITDDVVLRRFAKETGLPEDLLRDDVPLEVNHIRAELGHSVMGQPEAVASVADYIATFKAGLNDPGRPLATLLFAGPTGVGKTELVKATARFLFGDGDARLLRFDMSEYSSFLSAQRLLNESDGRSGPLIAKIRQQPFQIVLFDEIEKASPDVFDLLLALFDEGRLTDRYGRTANFCSSIIVMTSNLGSSRRSVGFGGREAVATEHKPEQFFRPEFFNRIDSMVSFAPLSESTCRDIVLRELAAVETRSGLQKRAIRLEFDDGLIGHLLQSGFDPAFGARPLQRTIEQRVVAPVSRWLLQNSAKETRLRLSLKNGDQLLIEQLETSD